MSAILTTTSLTVLDHSSLKHLPPAAQPAQSLTSAPCSIVWCAENGTIFLSNVNGIISRYDISTGLIQDISLAIPSSEPAVSLLCKDRGNTIIYGQGQRAIVLSVGTGKPANIFDTHKAPVTSLSLSNDSSLLASTSAHAIHIHNLTLASHTILRGIPAGTGSITTCAFHPHSRTRLLVGLGSQLLVYDTTRPSGPAKAVEIDKDKKNTGPIVAISCSPFSKTLVAVACSGGTVALVDLEKEKGLFRVVSMPAPITCLSFSAEGAALYAGTENGKFLLLDLRTLDKPPKTVTLSTNGDRVVALAVQRKLKPGEAQAKPAASASSAPKPLVQRDVNKATTSRSTSAATLGKKLPEKDAGKVALRTTRPRAATGTTNGTGTTTSPRRPVGRTATASNQVNAPTSRVTSGSRPSARTAPKSPTSTRAPATATEAPMKAFSPPRSPVAQPEKGDKNQSGDLSVRIENLLAMPKAKEHVVPATIEEAPPTAAPSRAASVLSRASSRSQISEGARARARARAESASHAPTSESISTAGSHIRSGSYASTTGRASKASVRSALGASSVSPVRGQPRRVSGSTISRSRTPSPELPDMDDGGPVTPIPSYKMKGKDRAAAGVLGLGTPEVDEWIKAGEAKETRKEGKRVGFASDSEDDADGADNVPRPRSAARSRVSDESEDDGPVLEPSGGRGGQQRARPEFAMQVSPRRSFPGPGASGASRWAPVPSPLRNPAPPGPASPQARAAQDMLQALLRDALHDFRTETKAEIVGLHLDMIRMGSSWRREMQDAVGGLGEELRALREENARLREENERLRRGY